MQNKKSVIRVFDWDRLVSRLEEVVGNALGKTETQIQVMEDGSVYPMTIMYLNPEILDGEEADVAMNSILQPFCDEVAGLGKVSIYADEELATIDEEVGEENHVVVYVTLTAHEDHWM